VQKYSAKNLKHGAGCGLGQLAEVEGQQKNYSWRLEKDRPVV
jgi:hypothetical protein